MPQTIFTASELNKLRECIEVQLDITQCDIEEQIYAAKTGKGEWQTVGYSTDVYFLFKDVVDKIHNLQFDFTMLDYQMMITPLELFIDMSTDSVSEVADIQALYDAVATLAKVKLYIEIHPEE